MAKRVCIVRQNYFPDEDHIRKNVEALTDAGFQVDVICLRAPGEAAREEYRGGTVSRLPLTHKRTSKFRYLFEYGAFFLMAFWLLAYRSIRRRYDIVELYNVPDLIVLAAMPAKLLGSKIIFFMFEMMPEQTGDNYGLRDDSRLMRILRWAEGISVRFAHRVITVSPYQRDLIVERSRPRSEPAVVMNVPEESIFRPGSSAYEPDGVFRVITHGSILKRYGIQTLIRAVPYLTDRIPELEVTILGDGEYRDELEQLSTELNVTNHVRFLDSIPHQLVPDMIAQADIGVVPMLIMSILPNKLFEYIAMKRPVVSSLSPSVTVLFDDNAIAYFTPDDEHDLARRILELYDDPARAERMAQTAHEVYDRYRWENARREYIGVHEEFAGTRTVAAEPKGDPA